MTYIVIDADTGDTSEDADDLAEAREYAAVMTADGLESLSIWERVEYYNQAEPGYAAQ